jgi:hypothetical protein
MPLLIIPIALVAWFVWFVLSRKAPKDAALVAPSLDGRAERASLSSAKAARALPRSASRALPPA